MHSLRSLPNSQLLTATARLASDERRITLEVLNHFREIERRKAYADLGFKSLFEYAVTHLRYSEGSASRRIAAMYALKSNPELERTIASGETTVTSVAKIHTTLRREEKLSRQKWSEPERKQIFKEMAGLPRRELEMKLLEIAPQAAVEEKIRPVAADLHEVKIFLTTEELRAVEAIMARRGQALKNPGSYSEIFRELIQTAQNSFQKEIGKIKKEVTQSITQSEGNDSELHIRKPKDIISDALKAEVAVGKNQTINQTALSRSPTSNRDHRRDASPLAGKAVPAPIRRLVFVRAAFQCEFKTPDGKRCDSRHFLQIEHRQPRALGGSNAPENLEILCRDHNLIRGIRTFGPDRMKRA